MRINSNNIVTCIVTLILAFSCTSALSAPTGFNPAPLGPNITQPLQPSIPVPTQTTAKPQITYASPKSCIKKGGQVTLTGKNFGTNNQQLVVIQAGNYHIEINDIQWTN